MQPSKRPKTPPAPERLRQTTINSFRSVVRIVDGVKRNRADPSERARSESTGVLDIITDDSIVRIFELVLKIGDTDARGLPYLRDAEETRKTAASFALTCRRVYSILETIAAPQKAEILARGSTKITPFCRDAEYPFTQQMRNELLSCDQIKMLQKALRAMACHCSKACCARYQKGFNKDIQRGKVFSRPSSPRTAPPTYTEFRLTTIFESCSLLAPCSDGKSAFAYVRRRVLNRQGNHGEGRAKRHEDCIIRVTKKSDKDNKAHYVQTHVAVMEFDDRSQPLTMRTSRDGKMVAFICSLHGGAVGPMVQEAFSTVYYWNTDSDTGPATVEIKHGLGYNMASCQDAWFMETVSDCLEQGTSSVDHRLVIASSSSFVHSSGHAIGHTEHPEYRFDVCEEDLTDDRPIEVVESGSIFECRCLVSCSPSENGNLALALIKTHSSAYGVRRLIYIHDIVHDTSVLVPQSCNLSTTSRGPLCASLSRTGDCIVSLHHTNKSIVMDVMVSNSKGGNFYTPVQTVDLTPLLALSPKADTSANMPTDLVKACYEFVFSPCGRFVAVVDRRPLFGEAPCNHGVVIVDMALRMEHAMTKRGLKTVPMFATEDQAPRSFHWTNKGIWLQPPGTDENGAMGPRGGAMCLYAPTTVSFS